MVKSLIRASTGAFFVWAALTFGSAGVKATQTCYQEGQWCTWNGGIDFQIDYQHCFYTECPYTCYYEWGVGTGWCEY